MTDSAEKERFDAAVAGSRFYIGIQASLIRASNGGSLPIKTTDQFSLGYLSGFVDGWMQAFSVEDESLRLTAVGLVFEDVFRTDGRSRLSEALSLMRGAQSAFMNGMTHGGTDAIEKIRAGFTDGSQFPPMTWAMHVNHETPADG